MERSNTSLPRHLTVIAQVQLQVVSKRVVELDDSVSKSEATITHVNLSPQKPVMSGKNPEAASDDNIPISQNTTPRMFVSWEAVSVLFQSSPSVPSEAPTNEDAAISSLRLHVESGREVVPTSTVADTKQPRS